MDSGLEWAGCGTTIQLLHDSPQEITYEDAVEELFDVKSRLERKGAEEFPNLYAKEEVYEEYQPYFRPEEAKEIREHEIVSFLRMENNGHWSGLIRARNKITEDIGGLQEGPSVLVNESRPIAPRFTEAMDRVHGMGIAIATAVLHVAYPEKYGVWNG